MQKRFARGYSPFDSYSPSLPSLFLYEFESPNLCTYIKKDSHIYICKHAQTHTTIFLLVTYVQINVYNLAISPVSGNTQAAELKYKYKVIINKPMNSNAIVL